MNNYVIIDNCRGNLEYRRMFFDFTRAIYPNVDFVEWHTRGFWQDEYVPHAIIAHGKIVSNVSATRMRLIINGEEVRGIQIGTVGTIPEYRGRGLSRLLMEHIVNKYRSSCDVMFLFANDDVLDFYPKFGFKRFHASLFKSASPVPHANSPAIRLSVHSEADMNLLQSCLANRMPLTKRFGAIDYAFITMWHILNIFPESLFYTKEDNSVLIANERDKCLQVYDVVSPRPIALKSVLGSVIESRNVESVLFHFPPDQLSYDFDEVVNDDDCPMFVLGDFAVVDRPSKFPVTAQT